MHHVRRAAIWTLGHKSKKADGVDAYVDGEYFAQILANSITNCRTSRVWRDPLSTPLTWLLLCSSLGRTAATQQHHPLARPVAPSASAAGSSGMTDIQTDKQNGMTIRLTLCERDAIFFGVVI